MARGNNGNLLQHFVEAELAYRLDDNRLHLISTHSMAPTETCTARTNYAQFRKFLNGASIESPRALHKAYSRCDASLERYPNTWRLLESLVGRDRLTGLASEYDQATYDKLRESARGSGVNVLFGSWRRHLDDYVRAKVASPWLITMDPYTFRPENDGNSGNLWRTDSYLLLGVIRRYLDSEYPGAVSIFCYSMSGDTWETFQQWSHDLAERLEVSSCFVETSAGTVHTRISRHGGVLLSSDSELISGVRQDWFQELAN